MSTVAAGLTGTNADVLSRELSDALVLGALGAEAKLDQKRTEDAARWRGIGLQETCRQFLQRTGAEVPANPGELFQRAVSTASIANLLGDAANKILTTAYEAAGTTSTAWAGRVEVPNFRTVNAITFDALAELEEVADGGELKHGSLTESKETAALSTFGRRVTITRKQFINDDLGALTRVPVILGRAAARSIDAKMYGTVLAAASGAGPTLASDSKALFATDHTVTGVAAGVSNYITSGAALSETGLSVARTQFRKFRAPGSGELINVTPQVLLVPPEMEFVALRLIRSSTLAPSGQTGTTAMEGQFNPHQGAMRLVVEPRLSDIANGATSYYLVANPIDAPSISIVYLRGQTAPTLERRDPTDVLGIGWWVFFDFAILVEGWNGILRAKA